MSGYCKSRKVLLLILLIGLSACASNLPQTLDSVEAPDYSQRILNHPLYDNADKFSFTTAVTKYPANNGYHKIPVGEYLLLGILDIFKNVNARKIKLSSFESLCTQNGFILPHVLCKTNFALSFEKDGREVIISGNVKRDVGHFYLANDIYLFSGYIDYNDSLILNQIKIVLNDVFADITKQLP
jgi:hypothetical protein